MRRYREEAIELALCALHLYRRDHDYLERAGRIEVIDLNTGRTAAGRAWSRGLHQMIELKEGCAPSPVLDSASQITLQRFFSRYVRLCGMSGTLAEGRGELLRVYGLRLARVPLRRPSRRVTLPARVFATAHDRWDYVARQARELGARGRAVLIGTDAVADSRALSDVLRATGAAHAVLDARHDAAEAGHRRRRGLGGPHHRRDQHGRARYRHRARARGGGRRGPARHPVPGQRVAAHRPAVPRALRSPRRARQQRIAVLRREPGAARMDRARRLPHCRDADGELRPRWLALALARAAQRAERARQARQRRELWKQDLRIERQALLGGES